MEGVEREREREREGGREGEQMQMHAIAPKTSMYILCVGERTIIELSSNH